MLRQRKRKLGGDGTVSLLGVGNIFRESPFKQAAFHHGGEVIPREVTLFTVEILRYFQGSYPYPLRAYVLDDRLYALAGGPLAKSGNALSNAYWKLPNFGIELSSYRFKVPNFGFELPNFRRELPNFGFGLPNFRADGRHKSGSQGVVAVRTMGMEFQQVFVAKTAQQSAGV